jgi:mannosyl-oligosaccharide glucosidase
VEKQLRLILPKGSRRAQLENIVHPTPTTFVFQRFKALPFEAEISFLGNIKKRFESPSEIATAHANLIKNFDTEVDQRSSSFDDKFEDVFKLKAKGFSNEHVKFAQQSFSNLMGGIGFFHGHNRIALPNLPGQQQPQWGLSAEAHSLFTATPSRSFFPRGFMWDEGFHQLIISNWDKDMRFDFFRFLAFPGNVKFLT